MKAGYIEMPLSTFLSLYPDIKKSIPDCVDLTDSDYIVRIDCKTGNCEIGYASDDWVIK